MTLCSLYCAGVPLTNCSLTLTQQQYKHHNLSERHPGNNQAQTTMETIYTALSYPNMNSNNTRGCILPTNNTLNWSIPSGQNVNYNNNSYTLL